MLLELQELLEVLDKHEEKITKSRNLYESLESGQRPERVPIFPSTQGPEQFNVLKLGSSMGEYRSDPETALKIELKKWSWGLQNLPEEDVKQVVVGPRIDGASTVVGAFCEVKFFPYHSGFGVKPALRSIKDVNKLKVPPVEEISSVKRKVKFLDYFVGQFGDYIDGTLGRTARGIQLKKIGLSFCVPVMPFTDAAMIGGETDFLMNLLLHPREAKKLIEIAAETEIRIIRYLRKRYGLSDPEIIGIADDAVSMLSPELFEEFALPSQKAALQLLSPPNVKVNYHLCGQSQHLLGSIKKFINPLYMNISYFTDLEYASKVMKDTILLGGPNPHIVAQGTREEIRQSTLKTLKQGIQHGLFMFGSPTSGWDAETPIENIRYVYSLVK